jgi:hypothetical protein
MNTPNSKAIVVLLAGFISVQSQAQLAAIRTNTPEEKERILVDLKITPSVPGFRAGVSVLDSLRNKLRLWVSNSEAKKFTVSILGAEGILWTRQFRDAYWNQSFDLSALDDGTYTIRMTNGKDSFERKILISSNSYTRRELSLD